MDNIHIKFAIINRCSTYSFALLKHNGHPITGCAVAPALC